MVANGITASWRAMMCTINGYGSLNIIYGYDLLKVVYTSLVYSFEVIRYIVNACYLRYI